MAITLVFILFDVHGRGKSVPNRGGNPLGAGPHSPSDNTSHGNNK